MQKSWLLVPLIVLPPLACTKGKKENEATNPAAATITSEQTLSKLVVMAEQIEPAFDPFVYEYTLGGETYKNKLTINTAPVNPQLDILINGVKLRSDFTTNPMPLVAGSNLFTIDLVNSAGTKVNTYKLTVARVQELPDETLSDLATSDGELMPAFSPDVTSYQLTVSKDTSVLTVSPLASYTDECEFEINGRTYSADKGGYDVAINPGPNTVTVVVKGRSGRTKTFTLAVTRPAA